jgi:hypothetical protein
MMPTLSRPGTFRMPHRIPTRRAAPSIVVPLAWMLAMPLSIALSIAMCPSAEAAKVYRCPDGSYADKPCGEGQRVVTTTKRHSTVPGADQECVALADDAEELALGKAGGVTSAQALKRVDESGLPYEQRTLRKKFVVKIHQTAGSPAEVRAIVEADCLTDRKAAAKAAAEKAAAEQAAARATTPTQTANAGAAAPAAGPSRTQCDDLRRTLALLRNRQRDGAGADAMEQMKGDQRDAEKQLAGLCPP